VKFQWTLLLNVYETKTILLRWEKKIMAFLFGAKYVQ
jgi:hypothetical protein